MCRNPSPKFTYSPTTVRRRNCGATRRQGSFLPETGKAGVTNITATQNATMMPTSYELYYRYQNEHETTGGNSVPRAVPRFSVLLFLSSCGPPRPNAI